MKAIALLVTIAWALVSYAHISKTLSVFEPLNMDVWPVLKVLPFIAAMVCYLLFTIGLVKTDGSSLKQLITRKHLIERVILGGILFGAIWIGTNAYQKRYVASISISGDYFNRIDWQHFQSLVPFKLIRIVDSSGTRICFERALGRVEKVETALEKAK